MIVKLPPSSTFLAAPKKRFGRCRAFESTPPERIFPEGGTTVLSACGRNRVEQDHDVFLVLDKSFAFSMTISATWT